MKKYLIKDDESSHDAFIEVKNGDAKAYNTYSKDTHNTVVIDKDGDYLVKIKCQGKTKSVTIPMYALFDIENIARCLRDANPNLALKSKIRLIVDKEVD